MAEICRLCATLRKDEHLVKIEDSNHEICQKLRECFQVEVRIEDVLPKCVCHNCVEALQQAFDFYTKVRDSQESLAVFYPLPTKNDDTPNNAPMTENSAAVVLKEQTLPLTLDSKNGAETDSEIKSAVAYKTDVRSVTKVEKDNPVDQLQDLSIMEEDTETTLTFEETLEEDIDDEVMLIEKILKGRNHDVVDDQQTGDTQCLMTELDDISEETEENPVKMVTLKGLLKRTDPKKRLTEDDDETQEISEEAKNSIPGEKEIEPVQCSDVGASNETWSSYSWGCHLCDSDETCFWDLVLHCQFTHHLSLADMQFKCADCQKVCLRYYNFVNHVRFRHRTALAHCCDVCDTRCADFEQLALHRRVRHANDTEYPTILLCDECGHGFSNQNSLGIHKKTHSEKQRFRCNLCETEFTRLYNLKAHQKVHLGVKEFSCIHCGKSFRQKVNLEAHMYSHSDDKPYECSVCKKSFKTSMNLMKHMETHSDTKHFKCDHCEKTFRTKDAKQSHERTHTGEMPYTCEYCTRRFRFRSTYLGHLNTHTGNRPYSCLTCDHHFTNWSNYNKHMKRRHGDDKTGQTRKHRTTKSNKKSKDSYFEYDEVVSEADDSPLTSEVLNKAMDEDTFSIIEETSTQDQEFSS